MFLKIKDGFGMVFLTIVGYLKKVYKALVNNDAFVRRFVRLFVKNIFERFALIGARLLDPDSHRGHKRSAPMGMTFFLYF